MKTVIEMAIESEFMDAGCGSWLVPNSKELERFAALVREDEREACAKVCEMLTWYEDWEWFAAAIRARGES